MADLNFQQIQGLLPANLTQNAYQQAGGLNDYGGWLQGQVNSNIQNSSYVTMDPSYKFSQNVPSGGNFFGQYNTISQEDADKKQADANKSGADWMAQHGNVSGNAPGLTGNEVNPGSTATPSSLSALAHPDLQHRQPSLAAGWGGWDVGSQNGPAGNANFTYYSRFS